ncbi:MAG: winged helix DNA-binding domain-containing protein [Actinobacteria bacterium]|nr:winged helix DNA-binding domain-containing protein [Actinomycetota bacterium]
MLEIAPGDARRVALWSAGLLSSEPTPSAAVRSSARRQTEIVRSMLGALGAVQLDTISVLARSHELIAYARYGAIRRTAIEQAYWEDGHAFEYWSHAACILPMESWPLFAFRRRHYQRKGQRWHGVPTKDLNALRRLIRESGPITTSDVGGAKRGGEWWDWSDSKIALEGLLDVGEIVVSRRVGWRRTYDLAENVVPDALLHDDLDDDACMAALVAAGARVMGVGTAGDIADVHRLPRAVVARHAEEAGLIPVSVAGWPKAWATPDAVTWLAQGARDRHRTTMLSPFDPLVWYRDRLERIFGMRHRIEAYTPAHRRVHGYFAMPVLHQGKVVARVDPKRNGADLHARRVTLESSSAASLRGTALALREAAAWVGAERVVIDEVVPGTAAAGLRREVAAGG